MIGVDFGATKILAINVNSKGKITKSIRVKTKKSKEQILKDITNLILQVRKKETKAGIGIPGYINSKGKLELPNVPILNGVDLKKEIEKRTKLKIKIQNDANCFAIAEHTFGALKNTKNSIGVIVGTGVGAGIIINKKIYSGSFGQAGEFGHSPLPYIEKANKYLKGTDLESLTSGPNIVKNYYKNKGKIKNANPEKIFFSKEKTAKKTIKEFIKNLAIGLAGIANILNPEIIVLGGGVSNLPIYSELNKQFKKLTVSKKTKIKKYKISDSSGAIGAALL